MKPSKAISRITERSRRRYLSNHKGACYFVSVCKNCGREKQAHTPGSGRTGDGICLVGWDFAEPFCQRCREANA